MTGTLIRQRRQALDLTIEQLAHRAGLSWSTVSRLERGVGHVPNLSTLHRLADALAVPVAELLEAS